MTPEEARAVAADLLRQAGDEQGARVLERAGELKRYAHEARSLVRFPAEQQKLFDLCAYLDPTWAADEVDWVHGEALETHRQRSDGPRGSDAVDAMRYATMRLREYHVDFPDTPEEPDSRGEWDPDGSQE